MRTSLQLRRDHFLSYAKGLSPDAVARLRHASALEEKRLFPPDLLKEVDESYQKQLQTKAFLRFAAVSTSCDPAIVAAEERVMQTFGRDTIRRLFVTLKIKSKPLGTVGSTPLLPF